MSVPKLYAFSRLAARRMGGLGKLLVAILLIGVSSQVPAGQSAELKTAIFNSSLVVDNFSNGLTGWVNQGGNWAASGGTLTVNYNIGCGSVTCPQADLVLADQYQPSGDWEASVDFSKTTDPNGFGWTYAQFGLWGSSTQKIAIGIGGGAQGTWGGEQTSISVDVALWNGSWTSAAPVKTVAYNWNADQTQTATLKKVGNVYSIYINGTWLADFTDSFMAGAGKIGLHSYGPKIYSNFRIGLRGTALSFFSPSVGTTSAAQTATLTNTGATALTISGITASGDFAKTSGTTCGTSLAVGASCTIAITFTPTAAGVRTGFLTVVDDSGGSPHTLSLSGTGTPTTPIPGGNWQLTQMSNVSLPASYDSWTISNTPLNGKLYLFGGAKDNLGNYLSEVRSYTIATNTWATLPIALPYLYTAGGGPESALASNGKFYLSPGNGPYGWGQHHQIIEVDVNANTARERASITDNTGNIWDVAIAAAPASRGGVYLFGGWNGWHVTTIRHYNPDTDTMRTVGTISPGYSAVRVVHPNGYVYLFGSNQIGTSRYAQKFNMVTETLSTIPNPDSYGFESGKAWVGNDGMIYFWNRPTTYTGANNLGKIVRLDPATDTFSVLGDSPTLTVGSAISGYDPNALSYDSSTSTLYVYGLDNAAGDVSRHHEFWAVSGGSRGYQEDFSNGALGWQGGNALGYYSHPDSSFYYLDAGTQSLYVKQPNKNTDGDDHFYMHPIGYNGGSFTLSFDFKVVTQGYDAVLKLGMTDNLGNPWGGQQNFSVLYARDDTGPGMWGFWNKYPGDFEGKVVHHVFTYDATARTLRAVMSEGAGGTGAVFLDTTTVLSTPFTSQLRYLILSDNRNSYPSTGSTASGIGYLDNIAFSESSPMPMAGLAPSTGLSFASQILNTTSAAQTVTLSNTGPAALTISSITTSGDFAKASTTCGTSLAAGANCTIAVTFTPTATGTRTGTLSVADNASGTPHTVNLTGTGTGGMHVTVNQVDGSSCPRQDVFVSVLDAANMPVTGLTAGAFGLYQGGLSVPFNFTTVGGGTSNVSVALTMDYSGSMSGSTGAMETAAVSFINQMAASDAAEIIKFGASVEVKQTFISDKTSLINAVQSNAYSGDTGWTSFFDGAYQSLQDIQTRSGRRAIVAMTDGADNNSSHTQADVIALAQSLNVPVFTIGLGSANTTVLQDIATQTGGAYYYAPAAADLQAVYQAISHVLNNQYMLFFTGARDGLAHDIEVRVSSGADTGSQMRSYTACTAVAATLSPTASSTVSFAGGSGTVSVTTASGNAWTATSSANWISISSGASGSGNGVVTYAVAANPDATTRTATLMVAGKSFTVTQASSAGQAVFVDNFDASALQSNYWTARGIGAMTAGGGVLNSACSASADTNGKYTISGNQIVIESGMLGSGTARDTLLMLTDVASGDLIQVGDTTYLGRGMYLSGSGAFSFPVVTNGASVGVYKEYRLTLNGTSIKLERGDTLANITETVQGTLSASIAGKTFYFKIGTPGPYYCPGNYDWVRVISEMGTLISTTAPGAPTAATAVAGNATATVSFTAPTNNGGSAITGYTVTSSPAGGVDSNAGSNSLTHSITGLTNGVAYTFTVTATNSAGTSAASAASTSVTPQGVQTITFGAAPAVVVGGTGIVSATGGGSGNPVTFSSTTTSICTVSGTNGSTVTGVAAGTCTIAASQAGNTNYSAAAQATQNITIGVAQAGNAITFVPSWNLVGNGVEAPIAVASTFNDATRVTTVWKWVTTGSTPGMTYPAWAFYTPVFADGGQAYAASKGYEFLITINAGEGFWVNAKAAFSVAMPAGAAVQSTSFMPALPSLGLPGGAHALPKGWSLIATGDNPTPTQFDAAIATFEAIPPAAGSTNVYTNLTTLWAWDAAQTSWYFWAPVLVNNGGLAAYLTSKGYLDFTTLPSTPAGRLSPTTGVWVNSP